MKRPRIITAPEAADLISDGATVATGGFLGVGWPEDIAFHIEERFKKERKPEGLTLVHAAGQWGIGHFAHAGMLKRVIAGFYGWSKEMQRLVLENEIEAYNLPQGVIINLYRDIAAGRRTHYSPIGLGTFVQAFGGALNERTPMDGVIPWAPGRYTKPVPHGALAGISYSTFPINVAVIRATTADISGNLTFEEEPLTLETLSLAMAARNSGGIVIAQVKRTWQGRADPFKVKVPGIFVDYIVEANPQRHKQTAGTDFNPAYVVGGAKYGHQPPPMPDTAKAKIARRAVKELRDGDVVNIGIGLPELVAQVAREQGVDESVTLTNEAGIIGGVPASGLDFGAAMNMDAVIDAGYQFDFYAGGGLDVAFLGFAEIDKAGNVNVSKFGNKLPGCGGFIDISQSAKRIVFCGLEEAHGVSKFVDKVEHITFSAAQALKSSQDVRYVTDKGVYRLTKKGPVKE